ncbi:uncharacterized protein LOC114283395 [Camellia sinensis]|uniref:uncharacterized protein LOC114283395 n=1 Tax=Camellia sinensis TaxID=4442 RepID=UPI001036DD21|nr:uncharacterized protein LOC114283395 [Camellia sinensis]
MVSNFEPRLFRLSTDRGGSLRSFVEKQDSTGGWEISFRRNLFVWEKEELNKLSEELCLAPSLNGNDEDKPVLLAAQSGQCIVSTLYKYIDLEAGEQSIVSKLVWVNYLPPKVQLFGWLAWKHKVKPSDFLQRIGILDGSVSYQCAFCNNELETVQHVLIYALWFGGCGLICYSGEELNGWFLNQGKGWYNGGMVTESKKSKRRIWMALPLVALWSLWKYRNDCLFNGIQTMMGELKEAIIIKLAIWLKAYFKEYHDPFQLAVVSDAHFLLIWVAAGFVWFWVIWYVLVLVSLYLVEVDLGVCGWFLTNS